MRCADVAGWQGRRQRSDATLDRTSDRIVKLSALDWAEIKLADIGTEKHPQQYPLLLDELFEMWGAPAGQHPFVSPATRVRRGYILREAGGLRLRYAGLIDDPRIHIISFSHRAIRRMNPWRRTWTGFICVVNGNAISTVMTPCALSQRAWACLCCAANYNHRHRRVWPADVHVDHRQTRRHEMGLGQRCRHSCHQPTRSRAARHSNVSRLKRHCIV